MGYWLEYLNRYSSDMAGNFVDLRFSQHCGSNSQKGEYICLISY